MRTTTLSAAQQTAINGRGGPDVATVMVTQQVNAPGLLTIRGIELNWVQPLGRWFDVLDGFGYEINHTHVSQHSEGAGAPAQAFGVSPSSYNGTLYFDKYGVSIYELPWLPTSPQITLNAINFTDSKQRGTFQFENAANSLYNPGYQILLGIRGRFLGSGALNFLVPPAYPRD